MMKQLKITKLLVKAGAKITWNDKQAVSNILIASAAGTLVSKDIKTGLKVMGTATAAYTAFNAGRAHQLTIDIIKMMEEDKSEG